jgi:hypothetical protein
MNVPPLTLPLLRRWNIRSATIRKVGPSLSSRRRFWRPGSDRPQGPGQVQRRLRKTIFQLRNQ